MNNIKYIVTIAGHDPSGGAGITSDIKTFEAHRLYGLSVCTAVTVQNDMDFKYCMWMSKAAILDQIVVLFDRFNITTVKIGIVESWEVLLSIVEKLRLLNPEVKIIMDPILKASAGYDFHSNDDHEMLDLILSHCYVVTPNYEEIQLLYPKLSIEKTLEHIAGFTNIYLKGGHKKVNKGWDQLYYGQTLMKRIPPGAPQVFEKHGSGCVLSSSLASHIALGSSIEEASQRAKEYTEKFLNSHTSLLGVHSKNVTS